MKIHRNSKLIKQFLISTEKRTSAFLLVGQQSLKTSKSITQASLVIKIMPFGVLTMLISQEVTPVTSSTNYYIVYFTHQHI